MTASLRVQEQRAGQGKAGKVRRAASWSRRRASAFSLCVLLGLPGVPHLCVSRAELPEGTAPEFEEPLETRVAELNRQAAHLYRQAQYAAGQKLLEQALEMCKALYPERRFPQGHPERAKCLNNLAMLLRAQGDYREARRCYERALAIYDALSPEGHPGLVTSLNNLGSLLRAQGEYPEARRCYERALAVSRKLYPPNTHPRGLAGRAAILNNLGLLLHDGGECREARHCYEQALAAYETLYPEARYPRGHLDVAKCLNNLSALLQAEGEYGEARRQGERALTVCEALYPRGDYPRGHPGLAAALNNLGQLLHDGGEYRGARRCFERALAMYQALYPKGDYPQGHPSLVATLNNLGGLFHIQGEYREARRCYERALAMCQAFYPADKFPRGHPELARSLSNLAASRWAQEENHEALGFMRQALTMYQELAEVFIAAASEAEALNFLARLPLTRDGLLSVSLDSAGTDDTCYESVWRGKATVARVLQRRQQALVQAAGHPGDRGRQSIRRTGEDLLDARLQLSRLLLAPAGKPEDYQTQVGELTRRKEQVERRLAGLLPEFARRLELDRSPHTELAGKLPPGTVFIDLLRYVRFERDPQVPGKAGERRTPVYVAFVLCRAEPVRRVELGPALPIERAVDAWRRDSAHETSSPEAESLRRWVWDPLARHLAPDTRTVLLAPDGALARLPWAALPGKRRGSVLLEDYALAVVPHGPFLLDRLTAPRRGDQGPGLLLAVGGGSSQAEWGGKEAAWDDLRGAEKELDRVIRLASPRPVRSRRGTESCTTGVLHDLPLARWAHFATHGFFADPSVRSVLQVPERLFERGTRGERAAPGARSPLVLSGLVLAGADPSPPMNPGGRSNADAGILTAEVIAGLPLGEMELAVLSACETGLGEVGGGEGVFGLQRAFHIAGAPTVVASLWKVDDDATQQLMTRFYENLWHKGMGKLEALRLAQLSMLNGSAAGSRSRGPGPIEPLSPAAARARTHPRLWAAWVLSGDPGDLSQIRPPVEAAEGGLPPAPVSHPPPGQDPRLLAGGGVLAGTLLTVGMTWVARRRRLPGR